MTSACLGSTQDIMHRNGSIWPKAFTILLLYHHYLDTMLFLSSLHHRLQWMHFQFVSTLSAPLSSLVSILHLTVCARDVEYLSNGFTHATSLIHNTLHSLVQTSIVESAISGVQDSPATISFDSFSPLSFQISSVLLSTHLPQALHL